MPMKQEISSLNQGNNHQIFHQPSVFDTTQHVPQSSNNTLLSPAYNNQKSNLHKQSFNLVAAQTSSQLSINQNNNGCVIQQSFGALSFAGQELATGQIAVSSYTQDLRFLKEKSGVKIGLINKTSQMANGTTAGLQFDKHSKAPNDQIFQSNQNVKVLQQSTVNQNVNMQNYNGLNLQKKPSFPGQTQNKLIDPSKMQIAATLSQQQPVARVMALENFQQQQNLNESTHIPYNSQMYPQNPQSSQCSNSTQLAITHQLQSVNNMPNGQEIVNGEQNNFNNYQSSLMSSTHTYQYNMLNDQNSYSIASQNDKENFDFKNVGNNINLIQNNQVLQQQLQNNGNRNKIFQIVNSAQNLMNQQNSQQNSNELHKMAFNQNGCQSVLHKQNTQFNNNSTSSMSAYSNTRVIHENQCNLNENQTNRLLQTSSLNEVRQNSNNGIIQNAGNQTIQLNSTVNINQQADQKSSVSGGAFKASQQLSQQAQKNISNQNHSNPFQQNAIKNQIKQIQSNQTQTSINLPRGTNPKRSFGRDSATQAQQSNHMPNQYIGSQSNILNGSILMKGSQNKQIGINGLNNGINRFSIHPILQGGHNQIVGLGNTSTANGLQSNLSSVQQQARIKNLVQNNNELNNQMAIVENQIKQQKCDNSEGKNQSSGNKKSLENAGQNSLGGLKNLESKYKVMNYDYNSSHNLHFKAQRNLSLLSGVNYPKKNFNNNIQSRRDESNQSTFVVNNPNQNTASSVESSSANSKKIGFKLSNQPQAGNCLSSLITNDIQNSTQMPQIIKPQNNMHQHSTSTQHQTIIQQQLISAPQIIGNTSKPQNSSALGSKGVNGGNSISSLTNTIIPSLQINNQVQNQNSKFQKQSSVVSAMSGIEMRNGNISNSQGPPGANKSGKITQNTRTNNQGLLGSTDSSVKQNKSLNLKNVKQIADQKSQNDQQKVQKQNQTYDNSQNVRKSELKNTDQQHTKNQSILTVPNQTSNNQLPAKIKTQNSIENYQCNQNEISQQINNQNQLSNNNSTENVTQQFKQLRNQPANNIYQHQTHRNFGQTRYSVLTQNLQNNLQQIQQINSNLDSNTIQEVQKNIQKQKNSSMDRSQTNKTSKVIFNNNNQIENLKTNQNTQGTQQTSNNNQHVKRYFTNNLPLLQNSQIGSGSTSQNIIQQKELLLQTSQIQTTQAQNNLNSKKRIGSNIPLVLQQNNLGSQHARNKSHNTSSQNTTNVSAAKDQLEIQKRLLVRAQAGQDTDKPSSSNCESLSQLQFEKKLNQINHEFNQRVKLHLNNVIEECDMECAANPQSVSEFTRNIMHHYLRTEINNQPKIKYMELQQCINERMRSILIDWIIEVHFQFKLKTESLFLTVNLIDRYLEKSPVSKENLQLVGVSAMLIACKYEEIWPPLIKDYIYMCDNAYDKEQIINMELSMLSELDFNVDFVSANCFLDRFVQITKTDQMTHHLAQYMIEISMLDYSSIHIQPSYMAMSALYLAQKIIKNPNPFSKQLQFYTMYSEKNIDNLSQVLFRLLKNYQKPNQLMGLKKKFSSEQFSCISQQIQFDQSSQSKNTSGEEGGISNNKSSSRGKSNVKTQASYMNGATTSEGKRTISAEKMGQFTTQKSVGSTFHGTSNKKANIFQFNQKNKFQVNTPELLENQQQNNQNGSSNIAGQGANHQTTQDSTNNIQQKNGSNVHNLHSKRPSVSQFLQNNDQQHSSSKNSNIEAQKMQNRPLIPQQQFQNIYNQLEMQKLMSEGYMKLQNLPNDQQQIIIAQMQRQQQMNQQNQGMSHRYLKDKQKVEKQKENGQYNGSSNYEDEENKSSFSSENTYSSGECADVRGVHEQPLSSMCTNTMDHEMV